MILHLLQWYLLIGCVVMAIAALLQIFVSHIDDENTITSIIGNYTVFEFVMAEILLYFIWPYVLYSVCKIPKQFTK